MIVTGTVDVQAKEPIEGIEFFPLVTFEEPDSVYCRDMRYVCPPTNGELAFRVLIWLAEGKVRL